ncbi:hypothetical protein [uncultured Mediterranean phage uvDeep-CGR2-AD3-C76]|nr:hypothetical protein [uncultured Mediterranean phage uvDeep-CGR2-AD3-C76]
MNLDPQMGAFLLVDNELNRLFELGNAEMRPGGDGPTPLTATNSRIGPLVFRNLKGQVVVFTFALRIGGRFAQLEAFHRFSDDSCILHAQCHSSDCGISSIENGSRFFGFGTVCLTASPRNASAACELQSWTGVLRNSPSREL